ncbi:MAG TPA: DUF1992 domain-containing protein [Burkholderiaceae bacterium]|nr:DUF1992 domain-containing protein [Burkholderiaceae bacterium]
MRKPSTRKERDDAIRTLDEQIADQLAESERNGELHRAPSWGKPLDLHDGYQQTPEELRMGFKILKDAGVVPHEVEMLREIAVLKEQLDGCTDEREAAALKQRIANLQQAVALRLEKLAGSRSL